MVLNLAWWILQSLLIFKRSSIGYACLVKMALNWLQFFSAFSWTKTATFALVHEDEGENNRSISGHHDLALGQ